MAGRGLAWLGAAWRGEAGNVSRHVAASRRQFRRTAPRDYPSEENTTANHLTAHCEYCHDLFTEHIGFISFVPSGRRTGASTGRGWGAVVSGGSRPRVGEVVAIWLRCSGAWRDYVVTGVIDGAPGS